MRTFVDKPAIRDRVPLLIGLMGPSGSGKTYSALRLASGIQRVVGGEIYLIDTETKRAKHYADRFTFRHIEFDAPFASLDYLAAVQHCVSKGAGVVIVDSMSHEHEGPGGILEQHETELDRMAGQDYARRSAMNLVAWAKPKAARRAFIQGLLQLNSNFIFCFRAKEKVKPVKDGKGETVIENQGWMPIAGDEFIYEQTVNCLLLPGCGGQPTWQSDEPGSRAMMKLPEQFKALLGQPGTVLSEDVGAAMAKWALGVEPAADETLELAREAARGGSDVFKTWWKNALPDERRAAEGISTELTQLRAEADARQAAAADEAA